jgi:cysteine desulfurase/selenocysteine lyase
MSPELIDKVRSDFPALHQSVHGRPLVYLDSAATALKPQVVIDAVTRTYTEDCANIHRAVHTLSQRATEKYEKVRTTVAGFLGVQDEREVIFVRGATEALNLVAQSFARPRLAPGDEVLLTEIEHHANLVPWQMVCEQTGASLKVVPVQDNGDILLEDVVSRMNAATKIVAFPHVSNALGTILPAAAICRAASERGITSVVDGAQGVVHAPVDLREIGCDFYAFSGHKLYAPSGIGVLWGRAELLEEMPPWQGGGDMIRIVSFEGTTYNDIPHKFEAGTPNISGVIGLGAAIEYLEAVGMAELATHEAELLEYGTGILNGIPGVRLIGEAPSKAGVLSFVMEKAHPNDVGTLADARGIAVRTGHHCAQTVMKRFGVPATIRASLGLYNRREDLDALGEALHSVNRIFA